MNRRDRVKRRMGEPLKVGDVVKMVATGLGIVITLAGAIAAWASFKTETKISDATTREQLQALENKHNKDLEQAAEQFEEIDEDVHAIQTTQAVMRSEQAAQTEKLDRILIKLEED